MDKQARAQHVRKLNTSPAAVDALTAKQFAKEIPRIVTQLRNNLKRLDRRFQTIPGANLAAKQTVLFDAISAETDGSLILHDLAEFLDLLGAAANDNRQTGEPILIMPFTDADVDAYEA
jgi:hypothetical protein